MVAVMSMAVVHRCWCSVGVMAEGGRRFLCGKLRHWNLSIRTNPERGESNFAVN
jgi:hypothetical protein